VVLSYSRLCLLLDYLRQGVNAHFSHNKHLAKKVISTLPTIIDSHNQREETSEPSLDETRNPPETYPGSHAELNKSELDVVSSQWRLG
jgi:hypothetical protein